MTETPYRKNWWSQHAKIICTLGPATNSTATVERLARRGMDVARLNLSHGTLEEHRSLVGIVREVNRRLGSHVAILMDLPGPKYRTGPLRAGSVVWRNGAEVVLTTRSVPGDESTVSVNLPTLPQDVKPGGTILVDDGAMQLRVKSVKGTDVATEVTAGGKLTPGRGVVLPGVPISAPFLTAHLRQFLHFAVEQEPDYVALSFVSTARDVEQVRDILKHAKASFPLISKIERAEAVKHFEDILRASDGIMVARGDLGVEMPLKVVPIIQKEIIRQCNMAGKAVITATQMLESMINSPRPTRAEVTDVANAVMDGTDAIMLSGETSVGQYPVQTVHMMYEIAREAERHLSYENLLAEREPWSQRLTDELISYGACYTALQLKAACIVAYTQSGSTARRVSRYRPRVPIVALTPDEKTAGRLEVYWGVHAFHVTTPSTIGEMFEKGASLAKDLGVAKVGDLVVITGGIPLGRAGTTNLLKVQEVT